MDVSQIVCQDLLLSTTGSTNIHLVQAQTQLCAATVQGAGCTIPWNDSHFYLLYRAFQKVSAMYFRDYLCITFSYSVK